VHKLLLIAGADSNIFDSRGDCPLIEICRRHDDPVFAIPLVLAKARIDLSNCRGGTPLQKCAIYNHVNVGRYLLGLGADMDYRDIDGDTPLFEAVVNSSHEFLEMLLQQGDDYNNVNRFNQNLLHIVAKRGDVKSAQILTSHELLGTDSEARDHQGRNQVEVFRGRLAAEDGIEEAFERLLESVREANEIYVDAAEVYE
jgi:ankyrin repeat protein